MGAALAAREKGVPLVNIAQPFKKAGMQLVCPKDGPVKTEADFKGKTLGRLVLRQRISVLRLDEQARPLDRRRRRTA